MLVSSSAMTASPSIGLRSMVVTAADSVCPQSDKGPTRGKGIDSGFCECIPGDGAGSEHSTGPSWLRVVGEADDLHTAFTPPALGTPLLRVGGSRSQPPRRARRTPPCLAKVSRAQFRGVCVVAHRGISISQG